MHYEILEARKNRQPPADASKEGKRLVFLNQELGKKFIFFILKKNSLAKLQIFRDK